MDWGRFQQARLAMRIGNTEEARLTQITGLVKQLTPQDWELIAEHERILTAWPVNP